MPTSSASPYSSLFLPTHNPSRLRRSSVPIFISSKPFSSNPRFANSGVRLFASIAEPSLQLSWVTPDPNPNNDYGGWAFSDSPVSQKKRGLPIFVIGGVGASVALVVAAIAYFSITRKGIRFQITSPLRAFDAILNTTDTKGNQSSTLDINESDGDPLVPEASSESEPIAISENVTPAFTEKLERVIIPVAVDSTQQEALSVLKKLKIIEDDVKADDLCTRREYVRWLVRMNSLLERDPRHRIIPSASLSGSVNAAFDDVTVQDLDFESIQALAEAGVVSSKLSQNSSYNGLDSEGQVCFSPDRFIPRRELIDWKAQLEYQVVPGITEQILTTTLGFMDVKGIALDVAPGFYMDMLAGDKSIIRKVFGQSRRFQPNKPSTKAQAAVALTSGRMAEAIRNELLRLKAESSARKVEIEVIRSELLDRGDIKRIWDEKLNEERIRGFEVEKAYHSALSDLEQEKVVQEKHFADNLKEKVAMDCQKQLLLSLKEEVNEMSEKLASERALYVAEQSNLQDMLSDLESKQEGILDTKSILEAEKEALRILRSWVEDEARKSQARAKVLEEVGRRWKWDNQS
ncbi:S-layer domain containing protein [Trema orientale]|uniref:S-layer domain containing protein n=1 Tax=Trema orientale TaxID=63057 RepID=A0A2P5ENA4_TREOI|nr:S-layer domain containing protein [Trema orientale]